MAVRDTIGGAEKHLSKQHFNNAIRMLRQGSTETSRFIRNAAFFEMRRLRVKRDLSKSVEKTPKGSDNRSPMGLVKWMQRIKPGDTAAIKQLVAIDATAVKRTQ